MKQILRILMVLRVLSPEMMRRRLLADLRQRPSSITEGLVGGDNATLSESSATIASTTGVDGASFVSDGCHQQQSFSGATWPGGLTSLSLTRSFG